MNWPLASKALLAFAAAAYGMFLITHVPQSRSINDEWPIKESETLRLKDPTPGDMILLDVRGSGIASITADPGSSIAVPTVGTLGKLEGEDAEFKARTESDPIDVRFQNGQNGLTAISVATPSTAGEGTIIEVRPLVRQDDHGITLQSPGTPLAVSGDWTSRPPAAEGDGAYLLGKTDDHSLLLDRVVLSVPSQKMVYIGGTAASNLLFQLGNRSDHLSRGGLSVSSLAIGGETGPTEWLACGAQRFGQLRWPGLFGGLSDRNCLNTLHLEGFRLADQGTLSKVVLSGPAFTNENGEIYYWPLLPNLTSNIVIQAAVTGLIGAFIAWLFYRLGLKGGGEKSEKKSPGASRAPPKKAKAKN